MNTPVQQVAQAPDGDAFMRIYRAVNMEESEQAMVLGRFFTALFSSSASTFDLGELRKLDQGQVDDCCELIRLYAKRQVN